MSYKFFCCIVFLVCIVAGCASALYTPTASHVTEYATLEELNNGRASYVSKCGSCHTLKLPSEYPADIWKKNLDEMQDRARMSNKEKSDILNYLLAGARKEAQALTR